MKLAIIGIFAAIIGLFTASNALAQEPSQNCLPEHRGTPGVLTTPCITPPSFEIESITHRFTPVSHIDITRTHCLSEVVATLVEGWTLPTSFRVYISNHAYWEGSGSSVYFSYHALSVIDSSVPTSNELVVKADQHPVDSQLYKEPGSLFAPTNDKSVPTAALFSAIPTSTDQSNGKPILYWSHIHHSHATMDVDEYYSWEARALKCQATAHQGHLTLKHKAAEAQRIAAQEAANATAEAAETAALERQRITATTSAQIDASRLESEKRITATEAQRLASLEQMIQDSIKVAAEITQIRIDRATARLESLERTATWLRDAAATDLDEWNTYYQEVEQAALDRIESLQVEAAAKLQEVQTIQDNLSQDLAESVARQQALTLQLQSQGGISVEDLRTLRQNAVDWLGTIDDLIAEAESSDQSN